MQLSNSAEPKPHGRKSNSEATRRQSPIQARIPYYRALAQPGSDRKFSAPASQQGGVHPENSRNPLIRPPQKRPSSLGEAHIGPCEISVNALSQRKFFRCGTFRTDALFDVHFHAVTRAQRHPLHRHDWMAIDQLKTKSAQKMREQNDPLLHREGHADAHSRPRAKRDVGETVDPIAPFAKKSRRIEGVRLIPEPPAPMQDVG